MNVKSRILQYFSKDLLTRLNSIALDVLIPDNNTKVNLMVEALDEFGVPYSELGPGTNRYAILIDGYVFKIGMDKAGIKDNWAELSLSQELQPFVTKCYECNGLICVAEYVTVISKEEFQNSKEEVRQILSHLAEGYLLGDVGAVTKNFLNWGYRTDGSLVILDYAYIYRIIGDEMKCGSLLKDDTYCQGSLDYDENFHKLVCPLCRKAHTFHEIRRRISSEYETKELNTIKQIAFKVTKPQQEIDVVANNTPVLNEYKTNNEGEEDMGKYKFHEDHETVDCEFGEEEYLNAIDFMRDSHIGATPIEEDDVSLIKNLEDVDKVIEGMNEDNHPDPLEDDSECEAEDEEDDDSGFTADDIMHIIEPDSEVIEDANDELEEETGISDEELAEISDNCDTVSSEDIYDGKSMWPSSIDSEEQDEGSYPNELNNDCDVNPEVEPDTIDIRVETPDVTVQISSEAENNTVAIETDDNTVVLTTPDNVDQMRALLNADLPKNDYEDYEDMYGDEPHVHKIRKNTLYGKFHNEE